MSVSSTAAPVRGFPAKTAHKLRGIGELPGPRGLPLIGNALQIDVSKVHAILEGWAARYGTMYVFRMGRDPVVAISDPQLIDRVLRDRPDGFRRPENLAKVFAELDASGVFSAEGAAWRQQRKLAVGALAQRNLRGQYASLAVVARRLKARWDRLADAGAEVDITEEFKRFTVDATTLIAFDHDINTIETTGDVIQRKLETVFPMLNRRLMSLVPWWRILRSPADRRMDRARVELRVWLGELVAKARARLAADPARGEAPANFLEAMLVARDERGEPFGEDVLFANLVTMLVAGEDTTAHTLAWAVHLLCDSQESVASLQREADAALGFAEFPADVDAANALAFAGAVASETMRLRPVAPLMFVEALADTVVGDLLVPEGTTVAVLGRASAADAAHFADPAAFRPRRWLGEPGGAHDMRASIPFGSGPRICPGRMLAMLEITLVLAMFYKNFEVERIGASADVTEVFSFTVMARGLKVRLRRRA